MNYFTVTSGAVGPSSHDLSIYERDTKQYLCLCFLFLWPYLLYTYIKYGILYGSFLWQRPRYNVVFCFMGISLIVLAVYSVSNICNFESVLWILHLCVI